MIRIQSLLLAILVSVPVLAQLNGNGYYRIQNDYTKRYITVIDGYGNANYTGRSVDSKALRTVLPFAEVVSDPASILYLQNSSGNEYDIYAQGIYSYNYFSKSLKIWDNGEESDGTHTYKAYASKSFVTMYLYDTVYTPWYSGDWDHASVTTSENNSSEGIDWRILPMNSSNYFGITPDITVGSDYYKSFCACFPFTIKSSGVNAYIISKVVESKSVAVIKEITGTIPGGTPVIFKCSSSTAYDNQLNLVGKPVTGAKPIKSAGNQLVGVYFCNTEEFLGDGSKNPHFDAVAYDAATMRVLGTTSDGKLAFIKSTDLDYIPANTAYITVSSSAPDVLYVSDNEDTAVNHITIDEKQSSDVFDLNGRRVLSNASSLEGLAKGVYLMNGKKVVRQ